MSPTLIRTTAAALAAGILLLLLVWALRPQPTQGTTGTNDPTAGQVFQVAVDTNTAGNPAGVGLIPSLDGITPNIPVGNTRDIDIIVDEVHANDGMSGFSLNLKFDPAIVTITAKNFNSFMLPGGFEIIPPPIPNTSGNLRMDVAQLGAMVSGEGVLVRFTFECIADGASLLDLADDFTGDGIPDILDGVNFGEEIDVLKSVDGQIVCGTGVAFTPSPVPTASPSPTPTPTPAPTASPTPDPTPTPTASPIPTATPIPTDTPTPGPETPTPTATATPGGPTPTPGSATPTGTATATASPPATPAPSSVTWGNIDCLAGIGPVDALKLLRFDAGLSASQGAGCPPLGSEVTLADSQLASGQ